MLGSCLIDKDVIPLVRQVLTPEDFYSEKHQLLYKAVCHLHDRREPVDPATVNAVLKGRAAEVGGLNYLFSLVNFVPSTANAVAYANIVDEKATARRIQEAARRVVDAMYGGVEGDEAKAFALSEMQAAVYGKRSRGLVQHMGASLLEYIEQSMNEETEGKANQDIVPTMFKRQNDVMPMMRGEVTVVPAASSVGKTTWMFNLLEGTARLGEPSVGFSLEMSRKQILQKMWAEIARINTLQIRSRALSPEEWSRSIEEAAKLQSVPLHYALKPRMKWSEIRVEAMAFAAKHGRISLMTVDYWQILSDPAMKNERDDQRLGRLVEEGKALAVELDCHLVILAQATINSDKPIPTLEDVKDSRAIVQAADNVLFLTRPLEFGDRKITLPSMDGRRAIEVKCNASDPTIYGRRRGGPMFKDVILGIPGKARMGPKYIIPYYIDLETGKMDDLFKPWPWDNERGAAYQGTGV